MKGDGFVDGEVVRRIVESLAIDNEPLFVTVHN